MVDVMVISWNQENFMVIEWEFTVDLTKAMGVYWWFNENEWDSAGVSGIQCDLVS